MLAQITQMMDPRKPDEGYADQKAFSAVLTGATTAATALVAASFFGYNRTLAKSIALGGATLAFGGLTKKNSYTNMPFIAMGVALLLTTASAMYDKRVFVQIIVDINELIKQMIAVFSKK